MIRSMESKNMICRILKSNRGSAFFASFVVMTFAFMLGLSFLSFSTGNLIRARRDEDRTTTFYLAEAGLEYIVGQITANCETNGPHIAAMDYNASSLLSAQAAGTTGTVTVTPDVGADNCATVISSATYRGITERLRVRLRVKNVGVWNNAIFAGIGQSGKGIAGNVDIRGSVHILGDGDPFSDLNGNGIRDVGESYTDKNGNGSYDPGEPFTDADGNGVWTPPEPYIDANMNGAYDAPLTASDLAADLSGNADFGNNYNGMPSNIRNKIPVLPSVSFGGQSVESLAAELRVKHGTVDLSGTATAGQANNTGNLLKETLDGVYVTDGFGGNQGASNVHGDNGTSNGYDLGNRVAFPSLFLPYTDSSTGNKYSTYEAYLDSKSLTVSVTAINSSVSNFSYTDGTNSISWNKSTGVLSIQGIVSFASDLDLGSKGTTINFSGRGTVFVKNDVRVHGDVMPNTSFPSTDVMGVIAKRDIQFATGSGEAQLSAMGAWFAERKIVSAKQNQFAGTFVSDYFDMGKNVPSIYQVPALSYNLPPGMPGGKAVIITQILSWRHI